MLDAVRGLRHVTARGARHRRLAGAGAHRPRPAAGLPERREGLPAALRRRRPDDQRAVLPRQPAASRPRAAPGRRRRSFRKTVRLAEQLEVPVVVTFSGCPGDSRRRASIPTGSPRPGRRSSSRCSTGSGRRRRHPVLDGGDDVRRRPRREGGARSPSRASSSTTSTPRCRLRAAAGPQLGVNFDPSHFFWQGMDSGRRSARSATPSSTSTPRTSPSIRPTSPSTACSTPRATAAWRSARGCSARVGWGHDELEWKQIVSALRLAGYDYVMSIEHEDALASVDEGPAVGGRSAAPRDPDRAAGRRLVDLSERTTMPTDHARRSSRC